MKLYRDADTYKTNQVVYYTTCFLSKAEGEAEEICYDVN